MQLFLFVLVVCGALPSHISSAVKYKKDNLLVLGDNYTIGYMDVQFNQPLSAFRSRQYYCLGGCANPNRICEFCDYTDPAICNGSIRSTGPCACVQNNLACKGPTDPGYVYPNPPIVIPPGALSFVVDVSAHGLVIPYHMLPPDNCSCFVLKQTSLVGLAAGTLIWKADDWTGFNTIYSLSRWQRNTICPTDRYWGETILIVLLNSDGHDHSKVRLDVYYYPLPSVTPTTCVSPLPTHTCLPEGTEVSYPVNPTTGVVRRFVITPATPTGLLNLYISTFLALVSTTDPWVGLDNSSDASVWKSSRKIGEVNWPGVVYYDVTPGNNIYVWTYTPPKGILKLYADTTQQWTINEAVSESSYITTHSDLLAAITVKCGTKSFTPYANFWSPMEGIDTGSANVRLYYPSMEATFFYPKPLLSNKGTWDTVTPPDTNPIFQDGLIRVGVIIRQRLAPRTQPQKNLPYYPLDYEFLTDAEWAACGLQFNGLLNTPAVNPLLDYIAASDFGTANTTCDANDYNKVSSQLKQSIPFHQDIYMTSDAFYYCREQIMAIPIIEPTVFITSTLSQCMAPFDSNEFSQDQCCVFNSSGPYDNCFTNDRSVGNQYDIIDWHEQINTCPTSECAQNSINELVIERNALQDPNVCGGSGSLTSAQDERVYWSCVGQIFGNEPGIESGPECVHDNDCAQYNSICSFKSRTCLIPIALSETLFIDCLYANLSQFTRTYISQQINANTSAQWLTAFSIPLPCSDPYNPVGFNLTMDAIARCDQCIDRRVGRPLNALITIAFLFSTGNSFSTGGHDCWNPSSTCSHTIIPQKESTVCALTACNTFHIFPLNPFPAAFIGLVCPASTDFCGLCENEFHCINVNNVIPPAACDANAVLCVLANGTLMSTPTINDCENINSCTIQCDGAACLTSSECQASGMCGDAFDHDIGLFTNYWAADAGGCFFDLRYKPPFDTSLPICDPPLRNTVLGCSLFPSSATTINSTTCVAGGFYFGDVSVYDISNIRWLSRANDTSSCSAYGKVCLDHITPSSTSTFESIYKLPPYQDCTNERDLYQWRTGRWLPGQARSVQLARNTAAVRFSGPPRVGISLPEINLLIINARNEIKSLEAIASSFCKTHFVTALDESVCSCIEGLPEQVCFNSNSSITSIGVVCGQEASAINAIGLVINVQVTSLRPNDTCASLFISTPSISYYTDSQISALRTLLVNYREDTAWSFRNTREAIVGKVLTNGFHGSFENNVVLRDISLCLALSDAREDSNSYQDTVNKYPILDVATRLASNQQDTLVPQNYSVYIRVISDTTYFCANLTELNTSVTYYMVQRVEDWSTRTRQVFETGEVVYLSILLALYALGLICAILKLSYIIIASEINQNRLAIVMVLITTFFVFRTVLFALLLSNSLLSSSSSRAINYLLFEFPILLYFCFATNYICLWLITLSLSKKFTDQQAKNLYRVNMVSIGLAVAIFFLFVLMIILLETVVEPPRFICNGQTVQFDEATSFALIMIYRVIFSSIAILIGVALFVVALMFGRLLSDKYFNITFLVRFKVYAISIIGGLGLIFQAIYFLVITASQTTPSNYLSLSILLCLEILPAWLFLFVEQVKAGNKDTSVSMESQT